MGSRTGSFDDAAAAVAADSDNEEVEEDDDDEDADDRGGDTDCGFVVAALLVVDGLGAGVPVVICTCICAG